MRLPVRSSSLSCFSSRSADISEIPLWEIYKFSNFSSPLRADISEIWLPERYNTLRLRACSSPVRSVILLLLAKRCVRRDSVSIVIGVPIPILSCTFAAKFSSGMDTSRDRAKVLHSTCTAAKFAPGVGATTDGVWAGLACGNTVILKITMNTENRIFFTFYAPFIVEVINMSVIPVLYHIFINSCQRSLHF